MNIASVLKSVPSPVQTFVGNDDIQSEEAYISNHLRYSDSLMLQADLSHTRLRQQQWMTSGINLSLPGLAAQQTQQTSQDISEFNPRLGFVWKPATGQALRLALQKWRRPAAVNSLAPVDTAGIPEDDRLVALGGKLERVRAQYEFEMSASTFVQGFVDSKRVRNIGDSTSSPVSNFNLEDLKRLSSHNQLLPQANDSWEATPLFGNAEVESAGLAVNRMFSDNFSGNLSYSHNSSRNTGTGFAGNQIPLLPRNLFSAGANWLPVARWHLGLTLTHRSSRYMDEANTQLLNAGWSLALRSNWESVDKRWSIDTVAENLHPDKSSAVTRSPILGVQALYRF